MDFGTIIRSIIGSRYRRVRPVEPLAPPTDQVAPSTTFPSRFMIGTLRITTTDPAERARLLAGRIVVREDQVGSDLAKDQRSVRPMWIETVDYATLRP